MKNNIVEMVRYKDRADLCARWVHSIRGKAKEFEHKQPVTDRVHPTLDDIASEIYAFFVGLGK